MRALHLLSHQSILADIHEFSTFRGCHEASVVRRLDETGGLYVMPNVTGVDERAEAPLPTADGGSSVVTPQIYKVIADMIVVSSRREAETAPDAAA